MIWSWDIVMVFSSLNHSSPVSFLLQNLKIKYKQSSKLPQKLTCYSLTSLRTMTSDHSHNSIWVVQIFNKEKSAVEIKLTWSEKDDDQEGRFSTFIYSPLHYEMWMIVSSLWWTASFFNDVDLRTIAFHSPSSIILINEI